MRSVEADQIVAAIVRGAKDDAVAGFFQFGDGLIEGCGGEGWGGGIDEADAVVSEGEKIFGGGEKTLAETGAALWDESEVRREEAAEEGFIADRGVGDDAGCVAGGCDGGDVLCGVLDKADVDGCGLIER